MALEIRLVRTHVEVDRISGAIQSNSYTDPVHALYHHKPENIRIYTVDAFALFEDIV